MACLLACTVAAVSCKKDQQAEQAPANDGISTTVLEKIKAQGFRTDNVQKVGDAYLVENDILLHEHDLDAKITSPTLRIAGEEQYRTRELVSYSGTRTIRVRAVGLNATLTSAVQGAVTRWQNENLALKFVYVTSAPYDITVQGNFWSNGILGQGGFPSGGNPYPTILINTNTAVFGTNVGFATKVLQHEIGHCIGLRHTDYMNRAYSCGGSAVNEGDGGVGAIQIPGTPSGPDAGSIMLACTGANSSSFNANDRIAINYLY